MAMLGVRGIIVFLVGLFGYALSVAALITPVIKLFVPQTGVWISANGFLIGASSHPPLGHELAGSNFVYLMVIFAFVAGSATTFLLRWLMRLWKPSKPTLSTTVQVPR
jgi:hypothetical protein